MAIFIFFLETLVFASVSWRYAIVNPRRQGPYRFVVFEAILALALSIDPALAGFLLLKSRGRPRDHFEYTTALVTDNVYRYIRHPMYASLLLPAIGVYLKRPTDGLAIVAFAIAAVAVYVTAKAEEQDTLETFGPAYAACMKTSKMFVPFVF